MKKKGGTPPFPKQYNQFLPPPGLSWVLLRPSWVVDLTYQFRTGYALFPGGSILRRGKREVCKGGSLKTQSCNLINSLMEDEAEEGGEELN